MATTDTTPKDFATLKALIIERGKTLPKRLSQIAAFALDNPDDIAFGTVASIAEQAQVQPSSLIRFSQAMGYQGFSELQEIFRARLRDRVPNYEERIAQLREHAKSASKARILFDGFSEAAQKSIADLGGKIDAKVLDKAVARLATAQTIYIIGLRRSFPISSYMAYAFGKLAIRHVLVDGLGGLASNDVAFATPKDAVLAVSFTPYASETVTLVSQAARANVPVIAITDSAFSPLARDAEIWFEVAEANFEGFRSLAATLALAMTLTVAVAEKRGS
ncbi:MAG: MurR/RpiR family transcriptional regulator [Parvibaculaceae bacterium]